MSDHSSQIEWWLFEFILSLHQANLLLWIIYWTLCRGDFLLCWLDLGSYEFDSTFKASDFVILHIFISLHLFLFQVKLSISFILFITNSTHSTQFFDLTSWFFRQYTTILFLPCKYSSIWIQQKVYCQYSLQIPAVPLLFRKWSKEATQEAVYLEEWIPLYNHTKRFHWKWKKWNF